MKYRQSLMKYAEKYGVARAGRKYNKSRSYIYFRKQRRDGSVASLGCQSRRPHGQSQNVFTIISSRVVLTREPLYFVFEYTK